MISGVPTDTIIDALDEDDNIIQQKLQEIIADIDQQKELLNFESEEENPLKKDQ